jgi:hypothetical protein
LVACEAAGVPAGRHKLHQEDSKSQCKEEKDGFGSLYIDV